MNQSSCSAEEVNRLIEDGAALMVAGEEALLEELKAGKWIGGSIPYFLTEEGGTFTKEKLFVTRLPDDEIRGVAIRTYDAESLSSVYTDAPENGFSFIIIPGMSDTHLSFALKGPSYPKFATRPLLGWISGIDLDLLGKLSPKVANGETRTLMDDVAIVMHVSLAPGKAADLGIVNIFQQGDGDVLRFDESSFTAKDVVVNGEHRSFVAYIKEKELDTRLPLVANYGGALINTSVQKVDEENRKVDLYAPVFQGVEYRWAASMDDYMTAFTSEVPNALEGRVIFSCNCILNYLYSNLEGKRTGDFVGPVTFGEIAYQLLNQTLVYLRIINR